MNQENPTITRKQTIVIEASQKQSISKTNNDYETILTNEVHVNNGDVIQVGGVYCDTTAIDPTKIRIENDIKIEYSNGMYLINQQIETVVPSSKRTARDFITDNLPYTLCQFIESNNSTLSHYTKARLKGGPFRTYPWGATAFGIDYMDVNGTIQSYEVTVPEFEGFNDSEHDYPIDIIGQTSFGLRAVNPYTHNESNDWGVTGLTSPGGIIVPIMDGQTTITPIDSGIFTPVINTGTFTIPKGDYSPEYMAKLLTDNFSKLNPDNLRNRIVQPTGTLFFDAVAGSMANVPAGQPPSLTVYGEISIAAADSVVLPFTEEEKATGSYNGWTMTCEFISNNTGPVFKSTTLNIIDSPVANIFRGQSGNEQGGWSDLEVAAPSYPASGGLRISFTPPEDYVGDGSNFLQTTANYVSTGVGGSKRFAFVDCTKKIPNNILTWGDAVKMPFGSTQMEILWDAELERMKFNYIHFPFTGSKNTGPALVKQINTVFKAGDPAVSTDLGSYVNDYDQGSVNQISAANSGVFFTRLEPKSFFETILGFDYSDKSIIVTPAYDTTVTNTYEGGLKLNGIDAEGYLSVHTPFFKLINGQNITRQAITISDVIGLLLDYTKYEVIEKTNPSISNGRVIIDNTQVESIIATTRGSQIGVQDSGYYVFEIEIGMMYNLCVGSSSQPKSFSRNIRAIVDRYYSVKSYTSSAGSNTEYIHYGNSIVIKSIKVRIRNSDGNVIKHIGNDNSVFLNVIKNNTVELTPPTEPETEPNKK